MKKLTKLLLSIMFIATVCILIPSSANAEVIEKRTWNGFVYTQGGSTWTEKYVDIVGYKGKEKNLTIPSEIKGYKVSVVISFGKSKYIENVHIPDGVKLIEGVLSECPNLKKVTISKTNPDYIIKNNMLLSKDGKTLVDCLGGIEYPKIPDSVTVIGHGAFSGSSIKKITLGKNITHLDLYAFKNCKKLEEINFHEDIGIKYIDIETFYGCKSLKFIRIPDSVIEMYDHFKGCTSLETIITGKNLKKISYIDAGPKLKKIYFYNKNCEVFFEPEDYGYEFFINQYSDCADNVTLYGFENSTAVKGAKKFGIKYKIIEESTCHNATQSRDFEYIVEKGNTASITNYTGKESKLTIPTVIDGMPVKKVKSLGESKYIKEVFIPNGIAIKGGVLSACPNLKKISVSSSNTRYRVKNKMLLSKDGKTLVACPGGLTEPKIPSGVTKIADRAFMGSSIKKITLGKNITYMGNEAFRNCQKLSNVQFHKNIKLKVIRNSAFEGCTSLKTIEFPNSVTEIWDCVLQDCKKLKTVKIGKKVKYIGSSNLTNCNNLRSLYVYSKNCIYGKSVSLIYSMENKGSVTVYGKKGSTTQEEANRFMSVRFKVIK